MRYFFFNDNSHKIFLVKQYCKKIVIKALCWVSEVISLIFNLNRENLAELVWDFTRVKKTFLRSVLNWVERPRISISSMPGTWALIAYVFMDTFVVNFTDVNSAFKVFYKFYPIIQKCLQHFQFWSLCLNHKYGSSTPSRSFQRIFFRKLT
jgi:hypothetical protein